MQNIWRPVEGYEGIYEVSNFGQIKSLASGEKRKGKLLKPGSRNGYQQVSLSKGGQFGVSQVQIGRIQNGTNWNCNPVKSLPR